MCIPSLSLTVPKSEIFQFLWLNMSFWICSVSRSEYMRRGTIRGIDGATTGGIQVAGRRIRNPS
jgi:hypothetical protein